VVKKVHSLSIDYLTAPGEGESQKCEANKV
jgi:hypothetical protein